MQITIRIEHKGEGLLQYSKQIPFAMALAINRTLEEGQTEVRRGVHSRFVVRTTFVDRLVKIRRDDRATKERLVGRLRIEGPEGEERKGAILARHEEGGPRTTGSGGYSIDPSYRVQGQFFLPTDVLRPSPASTIPRAQYPANLRLAPRLDASGSTLGALVHVTGSGKTQMKGKRRTFVLFGANGGGPIGIFQRVGPADRDESGHDRNIKEIWRFRSSITLRKRLQFFPTVKGVIQARYQLNFRGMLSHAIRTGR